MLDYFAHSKAFGYIIINSDQFLIHDFGSWARDGFLQFLVPRLVKTNNSSFYNPKGKTTINNYEIECEN